ncbi:hypothetical protein Syun_029707 [Stephania yunnanensis]|uniref:MULE transposase domain-containing protein n=1 Tax=Stephania yunnanensis TaxID=152371 RepID=A0AAP0HG96_9MAGN
MKRIMHILTMMMTMTLTTTKISTLVRKRITSKKLHQLPLGMTLTFAHMIQDTILRVRTMSKTTSNLLSMKRFCWRKLVTMNFTNHCQDMTASTRRWLIQLRPNIPINELGGGTSNFDLEIGLSFDNKNDLQHAVKVWHVDKHCQYHAMESTTTTWAIKCKFPQYGCMWRLRACFRKKTQLWEITQLDVPHTCINLNIQRGHAQLDANMIAREIKSVVKADHGITIKALLDIIKNKYGHDVGYKRIWDAKRKAIAWAFGDWDESYAQLPRWLAAVRSKSPGTRIEWSQRQWRADEIRTASPRFRRVFFAFEASINAFKFCRPLLQIDATFLYGKYSGKLMIAISVDTNGHILPVAFAIAETESTDSWGWFLRMLRKHVTDREGICVISDRHPGILEAVNTPINCFCPPQGYHRYCLRRLLSNFGTHFKNEPLKVLLCRAVVQHQDRKFIACMERFTYLSSQTPQCLQYINAIPKELWTQAHDRGMRYGWMNSNGVGKYKVQIILRAKLQ